MSAEYRHPLCPQMTHTAAEIAELLVTFVCWLFMSLVLFDSRYSSICPVYHVSPCMIQPIVYIVLLFHQRNFTAYSNHSKFDGLPSTLPFLVRTGKGGHYPNRACVQGRDAEIRSNPIRRSGLHCASCKKVTGGRMVEGHEGVGCGTPPQNIFNILELKSSGFGAFWVVF